MRRYDPIQRFAIGGQTLGNMEVREDGSWVFFNEAREIELDYLCLAKLLDGHDATECRDNLVKLHHDLRDSRAALKLIAESPARCAHAIAEMALLNLKPSGLEEEVVTPKDTPQ
jgi:hypothetical protein